MTKDFDPVTAILAGIIAGLLTCGLIQASAATTTIEAPASVLTSTDQ